MHYLFDTYAWVEYFLGSEKGVKVRKIVDNYKHTLSTPDNCIAEIKSWCLLNNKDFSKSFNIVKVNSNIEPISTNNWIESANIRHEKRKQMKNFELMDSIIIAKQQEIDGKIITGDQHFKNLKNIEFLS